MLEKYGVELIGANVDAIEAGEDRQRFKEIVAAHRRRGRRAAGSATRWTTASPPPRSSATRSSSGRASRWAASARASPTTRPTCAASPAPGLHYSPTTEVLLEESILGWKEFELELMRDRKDNVVVVCSIENLDPMGVHTGDSITVAPALTLTDREYQRLRDIGIAVIREVGVDTGGCNIQFAVEPGGRPHRRHRDEPARVAVAARSLSKATGFPIAKIAARLAVGYTLDEIPNDITEKTPASFEPTLDYVVVKIPRFAFEKFPAADTTLTTTMKSVGEAMAIGRCFTEALQKAHALAGAARAPRSPGTASRRAVERAAGRACGGRRRSGSSRCSRRSAAARRVEQLHEATRIDPWFLDQLFLLDEVAAAGPGRAGARAPSCCAEAKRHGFSDVQIGRLRGLGEDVVREVRHALGVRPVYKTVDTCAAEFAATHAVPLLDLRRGGRGRAVATGAR